MRQRYNDNTKRQKPKENQLDPKNLCILPGNSAEGLGSRRECYWGYISIYENALKKFLHLAPKSCRNFTWWFKEGCNWSIAVIQLRSVLRLHANTLNPGVYLRKWLKRQAHVELCHKNPDILKRVLN